MLAYNFIKKVNKKIRTEIYNKFISSKHLDIRPIRVKMCNNKFPGYVERRCHIYTEIVSKNSKFKPKPIILVDNVYKELIAHFILTDGLNNYDCMLTKQDLDYLRYFELPTKAEEYILSFSDPDERLYVLKLLLAYLFTNTKYRNPIMTFWKHLPRKKKIHYF